MSHTYYNHLIYLKNVFLKVHSFLKQCFARSSVYCHSDRTNGLTKDDGPDIYRTPKQIPKVEGPPPQEPMIHIVYHRPSQESNSFSYVVAGSSRLQKKLSILMHIFQLTRFDSLDQGRGDTIKEEKDKIRSKRGQNSCLQNCCKGVTRA